MQPLQTLSIKDDSREQFKTFNRFLLAILTLMLKSQTEMFQVKSNFNIEDTLQKQKKF